MCMRQRRREYTVYPEYVFHNRARSVTGSIAGLWLRYRPGDVILTKGKARLYEQVMAHRPACDATLVVTRMRNRPLRLPFTSAAIVFAVIVVLAALIGDINLIDMPLSVMHRIEQNKADAIVTAFGLVIVGLVVDNIRVLRWERREAERQAEQLRVVGVTMRTVQDIVNNCLNQLQLLHADAEGLVSEESLELFDKAIQETSAKLKALGDLEVFTEKQMAIGSGVEFGGPANRE